MPAIAAVDAFGSFRFMTFLLLVCSPSPFFLYFLVLFLTLAILRPFQGGSQAQRHFSQGQLAVDQVGLHSEKTEKKPAGA